MESGSYEERAITMGFRHASPRVIRKKVRWGKRFAACFEICSAMIFDVKQSHIVLSMSRVLKSLSIMIWIG